MKKISFYMAALLSLVLTACNDDFASEFVPQTNAPESAFPANAVSVTPTASAINLINILGADEVQPISIGTISLSSPLPANTTLKAEVELSRDADFGSSVTIDANSIDDSNVISINPATLQDAYYGSITKNPATTTLYLRTLLYTVTSGEAVAIIGTPGENYYASQSVAFTPLFKANISQNYYIVGGPNSDWAGSAAARSIKFNHSDADVYEDPVFTVIFDAAATGDTWFAIGDDAACDAIGNSDWSKLLGIVGGNSTATEGQLDFRYNMGAENSFCVPAGTAKKIKVTIDMLEYTFKVEAVNIADAYYLIGGPGEWNNSKDQKFSHSSASVADDPVFTYVFAGSGSEMWFAFGDEEAIDAVGEGTWNKLFGTKGDSKDLSGSFDRRYNLDGDHSFCVDGTAKFYRFQVNMAEMTYTITPLNFAEYFYEIGNESGWGTAHALYGPDGDGKYQGYYYLNGEFKFKPNADNWDDDLEYVSGDNMSGSLQSTGGPNCPDPGEGFYQVDLDAAGMSYSLTKVEVISIIGDFNGWGTDVDMTFNAAEGCWEATTTVTDGGLKFRMNHDWAVSWGGNGSGDAYGNLTQHGGANLNVAAGTYKFQLYISYEGNNRVVITKQ